MKKLNCKEVPCFRRWTRASWGIFASLHRQVKIGVLCVAMSIVAMSHHTLSAQTADTVINATIEQITVDYWHIPVRGAVAPVSTLYVSDSLSTAPNAAIETILRKDPCVDVRERGTRGVQADISLFGGTADQTMITLNGINFTDARTGHQSHSLPIEAEITGQIDIRDQSTTAGSYAGILNFTTAPLRPNYLRLQTEGGQYGSLYTSLSGAATTNHLSILGLASLRRSDGYTDNTDFNTLNLYTDIRYSRGKWYVEAQAGWQDKKFGAMGFYSLAYPNQFEATRTALASVYVARHFDNINTKVYLSTAYRQNHDRFELFRESANAPEWYKGHNYHVTDNVSIEAGATKHWIGGVSSLGFDYTLNHIYSNVLGEALLTPRHVKGYGDDVFYTKAKRRNTFNYWVAHNIMVGGTDIRGSFNLSSTEYGDFGSWSLSAFRKITSKFSANLSAVSSMRLPTFTDLYYTTSTHTGNIDLKAERATTLRLTGNYLHSGTNVQASVFFRQGNNVIDWVKKSEAEKWESKQITRTQTVGATLYCSQSFKSGFIRLAGIRYGFIKSDLDSGDYLSKYALDYLRNKLAANVDMRLPLGMILGVNATLYDRNGNYALKDGVAQSYKPYVLLDARLSRSWRNVLLYFDATNITSTSYFDFGGVYGPKCWLTAGISLTI